MTTPDNTQANGLLAWFRCDEASGDLRDASSRHYDATAQGNITYHQVGKPKLGAGFGVTPTSAAAIAIITNSNDIYWNSLCPLVSAQAWFKPSSAYSAMWGTKHAFVEKTSANADTYGWFLGVLPGGGNTIVFKVLDAATSPYVASYVETEFTLFHHYVGTFDGNYVRLYRDGVKVAETFVSGTIGQSIGYLVNVGEGLAGVLDDVAVWRRALTDAEVAQLYGQGGYIRLVQQQRIDDFFQPVSNSGNPYPAGSLGPALLTIGPFAETVQVKSGDNMGNQPMTSQNDQWVINGADWTVPAWVNVSTPHVIAGGTVLATLTPGQTMTIQLRSKANSDPIQGYGRVSVFGASAVGDGLNIVLYNLLSSKPIAYAVEELTRFEYPPGMADQLLTPVSTVPAPLPVSNVTFVSGGNASSGAGIIDNGLSNAFNVFENVLVPPNPIVDSITVDAGHLVTLVGSVGWTNIPHVDLYWQIATSTGYLTIPVSDIWEPFSLPSRQQFTTQYQIPECIGLKGLAARFVAEANGPGSTDLAFRYYAPWVQLTDENFINPCPAAPLPPPPVYPGAVLPLADVAPTEGFDFYDVKAADLAVATIYAPAPPISVSTGVVADTQAPQVLAADLPAGLYEFQYMGGAFHDGGALKWNYYNNTYFGQQMGGLWLKSGDNQPYYVVPAPCFLPAGYPTQAAAAAASVGFKFLFLHTGGHLYALTDYALGSGIVTVRIRNADAATIGTGEWTVADTTMVPAPTVADPTEFAPRLRGLSPGYAAFQFTLEALDHKMRTQTFAVRVWSKDDGSINAGFPYQQPKPPPASPQGWGGTIKERRTLFTKPPGSGNQG